MACMNGKTRKNSAHIQLIAAIEAGCQESKANVTSHSTSSKVPERLDMKSIATLNEIGSDSSSSIGAGVWDCNSLKLLTWPSTNVVGDMLVWDIHSNSSAEVTHQIKNLNGSSQAIDSNLSIIRAAAWDPHRPYCAAPRTAAARLGAAARSGKGAPFALLLCWIVATGAPNAPEQRSG